MPIAPACCTASPAATTGRRPGRLASLLGALKIARRGGQNHRFTREQVGVLYHEAYGTRIW